MFKYSKIAAGLAAICLTFSLSAQAKVTVFAAASMTDSLKQVAEDYKKVNPKEEVLFSFASSSTLAKQIEEGAPADLFISASTKWMKYLSEKDLTVKETEKLLVGNELVLISQKDSKLQNVDIAKGEWIKQLKDSYLSVGDPAHVPAGQYAEEALTKLNLWESEQRSESDWRVPTRFLQTGGLSGCDFKRSQQCGNASILEILRIA